MWPLRAKGLSGAAACSDLTFLSLHNPAAELFRILQMTMRG
jgi:hypothetical protein